MKFALALYCFIKKESYICLKKRAKDVFSPSCWLPFPWTNSHLSKWNSRSSSLKFRVSTILWWEGVHSASLSIKSLFYHQLQSIANCTSRKFRGKLWEFHGYLRACHHTKQWRWEGEHSFRVAAGAVDFPVLLVISSDD